MLRTISGAALPLLRQHTRGGQQDLLLAAARAATTSAKHRAALEELLSAVKNPELVPTKVVSKFSWIDRDRRKVEEVKAWEKSCKPLTAEDRPVVPVNKFLYNIREDEFEGVSPAVARVLSLQTGSLTQHVLAEKRAAMSAWARRPGDSGSTEVQVAALTVRINNLHRHLLANRQDKPSRRGLEKLNVQRRTLLQYMKRKDFPTYRRMILTLGLAPVKDSHKPKLVQ